MAFLALLRSHLPLDFQLGEPIRLCWYLSQREDTCQSGAGLHNATYWAALAGGSLGISGALQQHPLFSLVDPHVGEGTAGAWLGFTPGCRPGSSVTSCACSLGAVTHQDVPGARSHGASRESKGPRHTAAALRPRLAARSLTFQWPKQVRWPSLWSVQPGKKGSLRELVGGTEWSHGQWDQQDER